MDILRKSENITMPRN